MSSRTSTREGFSESVMYSNKTLQARSKEDVGRHEADRIETYSEESGTPSDHGLISEKNPEFRAITNLQREESGISSNHEPAARRIRNLERSRSPVVDMGTFLKHECAYLYD